jgi:hypothetical protein
MSAPVALPAGLDLSAFVQQNRQQPNFAAQQLGATAKPARKKAPTADQKRRKLVLDCLSAQDPFGLNFFQLQLELDKPERDLLAAHVKAENGI